jgi:hypothetical protein
VFGHSIFVTVDEILFLSNFEPRVNVINAGRQISVGSKIKVRFEALQPDFTASKPSGILAVGKHTIKVFLIPDGGDHSPLYSSTYANVSLNGNNYKSVVRRFLNAVKQKRQPLAPMVK